MTKRKNKLNLVIDFLEKELSNMEIQIKEEQGEKKNKIEFKEQVKDAIANLKLCSNYNIYADKIKITEIPEGGSEAYFTEFKLVDEGGMDRVPEWAIKKNDDGEIGLHCFDLIITKK